MPENFSEINLKDPFEKSTYKVENKVQKLKYDGCDRSEFKSEILNISNLRSIEISQ